MLLVGTALVLQGFYLANMVQWRSAPDRGWRSIVELGHNVVGVVSPVGERAGLRAGDRILTLNGKPFETIDERFAIMNRGIGQINVYEVERDGTVFRTEIANERFGTGRVLRQSGTFWFLGTIFMGIGALVFLMKPFTTTSWVFTGMAVATGLFITYAAPSYYFRQPWLNNVIILLPPFVAATMVHLAGVFPQRRSLFQRSGWLVTSAYVAAAALALTSRFLARGRIFFQAPESIFNITMYFIFGAMLLFLWSTASSYRHTDSMAVKMQALVVFTGIALALFVPVMDSVITILFKATFIPDPVLFYMFSLLFFPLSIGYAIARHDLFEFDVLVRRTYGYILSSAAIIVVYALVVSGLNISFQGADLARSPLFSIGFALAVVFTFRPLHERIQGMVDRIFYRSHYDYRKTIMEISEAMISLFDPVLIQKTLVGSVVNEMFLENGCLLLRDADRGVYRVSTRESGNDPMGRDSLEGDDAVLQAVTEKEDVLFRFEAELDPALASRREELLQGFHDFRSEMMIPLKYKDELRGIVSLGRKKSGKMFTSEDLDLLRTIINQSAVALENARLFEENLEKGRMEEELKIAHDLQVSMLPKEPPRLDGIQVAASSVSAREVGGDFYDFITLNQGQNSARLGVIVADVSGKAVSGALVMAASRSIFRMLAEETQPVHHMMKTANLRLKQDIKQGMFVALSYGVIDPVEKTLTISSAGQTLPIIASRSSSECRIVELEGDRFPLGIVRECDYRETLVNLRSDDQIIFYTDGVVEALGPRDEMYGFERLMAVINRSRNLSAPELHDAILRDVMEFTGDVEPHDDITVVVVKIL